MDYFVNPDSIVRKIWGRSDTILFIFAGAAAEFAVNKAVDWLYFTGKLPADPIRRLFSTVTYARQIVFSPYPAALISIDAICAIHNNVEEKRGFKIPDWAYRDVLFMLIDYSIRAFQLLERPMTEVEKQETFDVFYRVGTRMKLTGLPVNYNDWVIMRHQHLNDNLALTSYSTDLFQQYKKHLGNLRFSLLKKGQAMVVPPAVNKLLHLDKTHLFQGLINLYKTSRIIGADQLILLSVIPSRYRKQIATLNNVQQ
jgi:hypothetical protein